MLEFPKKSQRTGKSMFNVPTEPGHPPPSRILRGKPKVQAGTARTQGDGSVGIHGTGRGGQASIDGSRKT